MYPPISTLRLLLPLGDLSIVYLPGNGKEVPAAHAPIVVTELTTMAGCAISSTKDEVLQLHVAPIPLLL